MEGDCAYFIGQAHDVCQDYATVRKHGEETWAILSDGCSGSPDTDIGARLLARAAAHLLPGGADMADVLTLAYLSAESLGLRQSTLDATLMTVSADRTQFCVRCAGDGVVALQRRDKTLEIHSIQYPSGGPDYLSYNLGPARRAEYIAQDTGKQVTSVNWQAGSMSEPTTYDSHKAIETWAGSTDEYLAAAVFSDGVHSFGSSQPEEVAPEMVAMVAELLAFKTRRGVFMQRRALAFRRDCARRGWYHHDDLSVAVVHWGE